MTITEYLERQPKSLRLALGMLFMVLVVSGDYLTHTTYVLEFSPLYIVPVSFFSWFIGRRAGVVVAIASAGLAFFIRLHHMSPGIAAWDGLVWIALYVASVIVLGHLRRLYDDERQLSRIDPLTRIENRRGLWESLEQAKSVSDRQHVPLTLAYLDLDDFKALNDELGHRTGDKVLVLTSAIIRKSVRPTDVVARMGGDEFVVVLPATGREAATQVLGRVRAVFYRAMQKKQWPVTISVGLVSFSAPTCSVAEMIHAADKAMYVAKHKGKDQLEQHDFVA